MSEIDGGEWRGRGKSAEEGICIRRLGAAVCMMCICVCNGGWVVCDEGS